MKSKDKIKKKTHTKFTLKNIIYFFVGSIILLYIGLFYNIYIAKNISYAKEINAQTEDIQISNAKPIEIESIIAENTKEQLKEEYETKETQLEYITKYKTNTDLPKGVIQVVQEGREGLQEITIKRTLKNGELVSEEQISAKVTKSSINKIVEIGGGKYTSNYKIKVGDTLYVTSDRLSVMIEPDENSQKIATLTKENQLKLLEIQNQWYKIQSGTIRGFVKAENTTYINPNKKYEEEHQNQTNVGNQLQLNSKVSFNMALNKPSGFSLEQFKKVLTDSKDVNKVFETNAEYFYYIEKQYNINGMFVAAMGIHESAWGTSKISKDKKNLFGYGANDSNPYNGAYEFSDYSECIDLIARVLVKYYLNPKGTSIYGGEIAEGTYYNGPTLTGVNTRYATDKNWASAVYKHMEYLYNKL